MADLITSTTTGDGTSVFVIHLTPADSVLIDCRQGFTVKDQESPQSSILRMNAAGVIVVQIKKRS